MASHTAEEISEEARRKLIELVIAARVHACFETTTNKAAARMVEYWSSLPLIEVLPFLALLNAQRSTPSASCRTSQPRDGANGRSALGGDLPTEGPTGRTTVTA
jgi:hypothetical protein